MSQLLEISLTNALTATFLALIVGLIGAVYRRPALLHALWILVLLKLVTPPLFRVAIAFPEVPETRAEAGDIATDPPAADFAINVPVPETPSGPTSLYAPETPEISATAVQPDPELVSLAPFALSADAAMATAPVVLEWELPSWRFTLGVLWLAGSAGIILVTIQRICAFHRLLRFADPACPALQRSARLLCERLGMKACPAIWIVSGAVSPLVWAVGGRARLILPEGLVTQLTPEARDTLLIHELAHIRRRDHWVRWLELVVVAVFWWHPVAWIARWRIQQLEEECCDAWVVWALPAAARTYAKALLQTVDFLADVRPALPPAASGLGYVTLLKRRLTMILGQPLNHRLSWPALVGAALLGMLVLPIAPQRLIAKATDDPPDVVDVDEDADSGQAGGSDRQDMERRLNQLEQKMDRVLRALERSPARGEGSPSEPSADVKRKIEEAKQKAKEAREKARADAERMREKARAERERAREKARAEAERAKDRSPDGKTLETQSEKLKQLDESIRRAINPERMERLAQEIERAVDKSVSPERMQALGKQIEDAVNKAVGPQRMEALARQIEEAVNRAVRAQELAEAKSKRESSRGEGTSSRGQGRSERTARSGSQDLERRMEKLEQKMDRVLAALEKSKSGR